MLQLAVGRGVSAPARLLSGSTMPKKAGATSKASGKSRGVERVGHGATPAGTRSGAWRVEDLPDTLSRGSRSEPSELHISPPEDPWPRSRTSRVALPGRLRSAS